MSKRHERLTELFLREINNGLRDVPRLNEGGIVTITGAELTGDDEQLKVYYSVLGTQQQAELKGRILSAHARELRTMMYRRLRLKSIPEIIFEYDDTPERAAHIEEIFKKIREEKSSVSEETPENNDGKDTGTSKSS